MDKFEQIEMMKKIPLTKNTRYDRLINCIPEPIKKQQWVVLNEKS